MKSILSKFSLLLFLLISHPSNSYSATIQKDEISEEAYKLLYENTLEANGKILDTVYWSLAGMFTVILLFIGSNIYFNVRSNKIEMEKLTNEYKGKLTDSVNFIQKKAERDFIEFKDRISDDISERISGFNEQQVKQIENFSNAITLQLQKSKDKLDYRVRTIEEVNEDQNVEIHETKVKLEKQLTREIDKLKKHYNHELKLLYIQDYENNAEIDKIKGVEANYLANIISAANISIEIDYPLDLYFEDIIESIKRCEDYEIDADLRVNLTELLIKADDKYISLKEKINKLLKEK